MKKKEISTEELDRMLDDGEDIDEYVDWDKSWRPDIAELAQKARAATGLTQKAFSSSWT